MAGRSLVVPDASCVARRVSPDNNRFDKHMVAGSEQELVVLILYFCDQKIISGGIFRLVDVSSL
jgi:hypothetical protein